MTWFQEGLGHVQDYVDTIGGRFMASDVRDFAEERGFVAPCDKRVWGAIMKAAAKSGVIRADGYEKTTNPKAHGTPAVAWLAVTH